MCDGGRRCRVGSELKAARGASGLAKLHLLISDGDGAEVEALDFLGAELDFLVSVGMSDIANEEKERAFCNVERIVHVARDEPIITLVVRALPARTFTGGLP